MCTQGQDLLSRCMQGGPRMWLLVSKAHEIHKFCPPNVSTRETINGHHDSAWQSLSRLCWQTQISAGRQLALGIHYTFNLSKFCVPNVQICAHCGLWSRELMKFFSFNPDCGWMASTNMYCTILRSMQILVLSLIIPNCTPTYSSLASELSNHTTWASAQRFYKLCLQSVL